MSLQPNGNLQAPPITIATENYLRVPPVVQEKQTHGQCWAIMTAFTIYSIDLQ